MPNVEIVSRETWEDGIRDSVRYSTTRTMELLRELKHHRQRTPVVDQALLDSCIKEIRALQERVEVS
jgi:hypothetical protein